MSDVGKTFDAMLANQTATHETNDGDVVHEQSTYSFDDVEKLTSKNDEETVKEVKKEVKEEKAEKQEKAESNERLKKELEPKKNEGIEDKVEDHKRHDNDEEVQEPLKEIKKLQAKFGEDSLEIPTEALIPHKVDGEETEIPLQELLNNYSGKVAWDKRFSELDKERKEYQTERSTVERYINDFAKLAQGNDKLAAMEYLAQFAGVNPLEFKKQLREQVLEKYSDYNNLSEVERKALDLEEENMYYKRTKESEQQQLVEQQSRQELQQQIEAIQETHQLTEDDLVTAFKELDESGFEGEITPQILEKYIVNKNAYFNAKSHIEAIDSNLIQEHDGIVEEVADILLSNPELDENDIREILDTAFGGSNKKKKQQEVSDRVREDVKKQAQPIDTSKRENYLTFDDLEF